MKKERLKDYNTNNLSHIIKSGSADIVLFGAGDLGKLVLYALKELGIKVYCFCDSNKLKQGKLHCGLKTISPEQLLELGADTHIFICNNYIVAVSSLLKQMNFTNIYDCVILLKNTNFSAITLDVTLSNIKRQIDLHKSAYFKINNIASNTLNVKSVDIVVTERCSLKCRDCSNLMQYYAKPEHCDLNLLFKSVDRFMECIDWLHEFRVLGGEPFVNKQLYKIINKLTTYKNANNVVIYTNGTIVCRGENLSCLKNDKVTLDITNYGTLSKKHNELINVLEANNVAHITTLAGKWNYMGEIRYRERSVGELNHMFMNCCANDIITLLHGKLYRCPFSAHATNLKAIPCDDNDIIDLADESMSIDILKTKIKRFYANEQHISACSYCSGRDYDSVEINPATQIKNPLLINP